MGQLLLRRNPIDRIEVRIGRLGAQADRLFAREQKLRAKIEDLERAARQPTGRLGAVRVTRALRRTEGHAIELRMRRAKLVESEVRSIMLALQEQSRRTRDWLDRELERLLPVEAEWQRLRSTFEVLAAAVESPALDQISGQWRGELEIPEFPVRAGEGYAKPFPTGAVVF